LFIVASSMSVTSRDLAGKAGGAAMVGGSGLLASNRFNLT